MTHHRTALFCLFIFTTTYAQAGEWNQWLGPHRNGMAIDSPALIESLPERGIKPNWIVNQDTIPGISSSGWASPIVTEDYVLLFTHKKTKTIDGKLPPVKFPYLPPEKRTGMTDEEYKQYEVKRRDEQQRRAKSYRYDEFLYCLHRKNGKLVWSNEHSSVYTRFAQSASPTVNDGRVFLQSAGRLARCVDLNTGKEIWSTQIPGEFRDEYLQSSFLVVRNIAITLSRGLIAFDADNGEILWQIENENGKVSHCSPAIWDSPDGPVVICNIGGGDTKAVLASTGETVWELNVGANHSSPLVFEDKLILYSSSRKNGLLCFELNNQAPKQLWQYRGVADSGSTPVISNGLVFAQGERRLACIDLSDGREQWMTMLDMNRPRYSSLISADNQVFYGFDGVLAFKASKKEFTPTMRAKIDRDGLLADEEVFREKLGINNLERTAEGQIEAEKLWNRQFSNGPLVCTTPAIADGVLFIRLKHGIACYDLSSRSQ